MRFRAKFDLLDCCYLALGLLPLVLLLSPGGYRGMQTPWLVALWVALALQRLIPRVFTYWEVSPEGLFERRLWRERTVAWNEIVSVSPWPEGKSASRQVAVSFGRSAPLSDRGQVIANPGDPDSFLMALREHAPQARFDGLPAQRFVPQG
ncbi:MAG TPA: hypothetical protein VIY53_09045 [Acidobacteriaceae bacterium]